MLNLSKAFVHLFQPPTVTTKETSLVHSVGHHTASPVPVLTLNTGFSSLM